MAKNKNNTKGKGSSGVKEWAELQGANVTTGISLNDTNKFLKKFPNNPSALAHRADVLVNIAASKAASEKRLEASLQQAATPLNVASSSVTAEPGVPAQEPKTETPPPKVEPPKVEQTRPESVPSKKRPTTELKPLSYDPNEVSPNRDTFKAQTRSHAISNIKRSNLIDKKAGLSSDLDPVSGSLKPFSYNSIKDGTHQTVEVHSSGNTIYTGQPVKNQITAERKASWDTARELLNSGVERSSFDNSGVNWTKFSPVMINRTGMPGYADKQRSKPFPEYHQGHLDKDGKYAPLVPKRVSHALNPPKLNKGEELSQSVINEDVEKQREEAIKPKPSGGMFSKTTPEEKARLTRLDELTAAYHGLNTNVTGSKGSVEVERRGKSFSVVANDATFDPEIDSFVGQRTDKVTQIDSMTSSPFPTQLTGINNLEGSDLDAFKAAYNQDLELNRIGKQAGFVDLKDSGIYLRDPLTQEVMTKRSIDPWAGSNQRSLTHGYGMGWGNMWRASAKDNAKRAMTVVNPLSRGNISLMMEQLGRVSTRDMLAFKANPTIMNRLGITAAPAFAAGFVGYGMYDNQDIGEIVSNLAVPALALPGARAGLAIGSFLAPAKTATNFGILRAGSMAVGATVGFVTGASVALAATAGISDITNNESSIRKFASKMAKTEFLVPEVNSRQSLTARQMALNKLSKSGLNDRALLLGNEAAALGGYL